MAGGAVFGFLSALPPLGRLARPQRRSGSDCPVFVLEAALTIGPQTDYSRALVGPAKGAISGESELA